MSLEVRGATSADRGRWDDYVASRCDAHFGQRWAWREVIEQGFGCAARWTLAEQDGRVRGVLPLFEKRGHALFSAPGGLLADDDATAIALLAAPIARVRRERLDWLELRDQRREWPGLETNPEHCTLVVALQSSEQAQWKAFDAKLRNQIRKGQRSGWTARWDRGAVDAFHRVMVENLRDLGTPVRGAAFFRRVLDAYGADADLLLVERDGEVGGAMCVVRQGRTLSDPWASSLRRHFASCPNQVLYWEALRRAIADGCTQFDLGRSQWQSGTFHFKTQWGATPVPLFYQYARGRAARIPTLAAQQHGFDLAVRVWKRLPVPVAAALGEPVRRRFPEVL
ncbi:MAG TPA: GNAT family N-acetyltransferase [Candidatus Eisenbacteria bacterium]|nr:GNAT family N-acetyltransferase [Candidatus Eisenbacteria bacterium]